MVPIITIKFPLSCRIMVKSPNFQRLKEISRGTRRSLSPPNGEGEVPGSRRRFLCAVWGWLRIWGMGLKRVPNGIGKV
jgi:hypothetical protein